MTEILWPASLPLDPLIAGYDETLAPGTNVLRSPMDAGPAKTRRRFTAAVRPLSISLALTRAQVAILDAFVDETLAGGALPFVFTHPRTQAPVTMRVIPPIGARPSSGQDWIAPLKLEILP